MRSLLIAVLVTFYLRLLGWTSRIEILGEENLPQKPFIYVFWHSRLMLLAYSHRGRGSTILVSTSKDGDISAIVNRQVGNRVIRGTASNESQARRSLLKLVKTIRENKVIVLTPDGPRGPKGEVKKGIPFIAQKTGCPIVPITYSAKRKIILNTWDKFLFPLPFNRAVVLSGKPIYVKKNENIDEAALRIKKVLDEMTAEADCLARAF